MLIQKTHIRNVAPYLEGIALGAELRPAIELTDRHRHKLVRIGFPERPASGDTILPNGIGPVSRFNADGRWKVHRDRPKEDRYVRTIRWSWKTWRGRNDYEEHEDFKDIYRECYPRTFEAPPGSELTYMEAGGAAYVVATPLRNSEANRETIRHVINLYLETFGECELLKGDLGRFDGIEARRLTWKMLPPGRHPWSRLHSHLSDSLKRYSENTKSVIFDRQKTLLDHGPDEQFIGMGGFSDYIAYVFHDRGLVVLESIRKGNAIYVFGQNWTRFSKLTKAEILNQDLNLARIVHTAGWKERLERLLSDRAAA